MNYKLVDSFFTIALLRRFSTFCEILTSEWLDDVIQSATPYVTIKYRESNDRDFTQIKLNQLIAISISK